jgi:hypothetical protein
MKKVYNLLILLLLAVFGSSCEKNLDSEGVSRTTYYVTFNLTGGPLLTVPKGTAFVDPGFTATEGTSDVTGKAVVTGTVDANTVGMYKLNYNAVNADGYQSATTRTVIVYDPNAPATDLTGDYSSNVARQAPARAFTGLNVSISKEAPGFFYVTDLLGGFYDQGSNYGYGPAYAMTGYVQLHPDNTITIISSHVAGWGDSANGLTAGVYNPVTKTITWTVDYTANHYKFLVTLTPKQ